MNRMVVAAFAAMWVSGASAAEARVVQFETKKIGTAVHWVPERVSVKPGETIKLVAKHDLPEGFEIHGFTIKEMNVSAVVKRGTPFEREIIVPATAKAGDYVVGCQLHPAHVAAKLTVETAVESAPEAPKK